MKINRFVVVWLSIFVSSVLNSYAGEPKPFLSQLHATKESPLYTTYAAAMKRSQFVLDEGYHFVFYDSTKPLEFTNRNSGDFGTAFKVGSNFICSLNQFYKEPVITTSYGDIVKYYYYPTEELRVDATFFVYSSRIAIQDLTIKNIGKSKQEVNVIPFFMNDKKTFREIRFDEENHLAGFVHDELPDEWTRDHKIPSVDMARDFLAQSAKPTQLLKFQKTSWETSIAHQDSARIIAFANEVEILPGHSYHIRIVKGAQSVNEKAHKFKKSIKAVFNLSLDKFVKNDEKLYRKIPRLHFSNPDEEMLYWSGFTLLRQVMLPPEGKCHYNYYVFSREPQWGWGHGGQVFHESLSMLAYVFMDPVSAMNSQRVYMERQHADGYINYRTGPYLGETIPYNNQLTTSAPWFNWENWEIYKVTKDREFLREAYDSGEMFFNYWLTNRDSLHDGLCEWGGHAVLESVRDGDVAVWDQVGWPSNFEGPDLNSMLVEEAKTLESMANVLGKTREAEQWKAEAQERAELINKYMWDVKTSFYYNVDMKSKTFTFKKKGDLKRQEIIGFLPLWAGVATRQQADSLVKIFTIIG